MVSAADKRITPGKPRTPAAVPPATAAVFKKSRRDLFDPGSLIFSDFFFMAPSISK
jgi:hypothetical protein